jgi:hypothetical protein
MKNKKDREQQAARNIGFGARKKCAGASINVYGV